MLLKQQMLESLRDESWKLPVAYLFLSGIGLVTLELEESLRLKMNRGSEQLNLSLPVVLGLCWLEASFESDWALYT